MSKQKKRNQFPTPPQGYVSLEVLADRLGLSSKYTGTLVKRSGLETRRMGVYLYIEEVAAETLYNRRLDAEKAAEERKAAASGAAKRDHLFQITKLPPARMEERTRSGCHVCAAQGCEEVGVMTRGGQPYCYPHFLDADWNLAHMGVRHAA